jgi:N-acetylglucosaminyldiphosphoundecaprenol N-acetyl-beta-D-mannosaminyltransferase
MLNEFVIFKNQLCELSDGKTLINTINAHSYNVAKENERFYKVLLASDILLPDGISIVWAYRLLTGKSIRKIAGADLFKYEMERMQKNNGTVFFLGSTESVLEDISRNAKKNYPQVEVQTYSPPFKKEFDSSDNQTMLNVINAVKPDVLFVGMTAPKQEIWAYEHKNVLEVGHICCVGAVFDFYAGTVKRAPNWMIGVGLEWLYRLIMEPKRMWKRYLIGNFKFIFYIVQELLTNIRFKKNSK